MPIDPRTPVLVGAAAVSQKVEDPQEAAEPIELMTQALELAARDAGAPDLLKRADTIRVPRGFPPYADPARLLADRLGIEAKTEVANIGILQTTLLGRSVDSIASGKEEVVLICGGEAKYRALRAQILGAEPHYTSQGAIEPDITLEPHDEILSHAELVHGLGMPVSQYALIENALRFAAGQTLEEHIGEVSEMWAAMSRVAAENPYAWSRSALTADEIATPTEKNRMLASPYTKRHNSQWNVDQAAGLILCAAQTARSMGIPRERWIFPRAVVDANHMVPLCERAELHRSHGFRLAGRRAFAMAGLEPEQITHRELYSCFPAAVRVQAKELGLDPAQALTVTGGMAFAGGPLNNFVLQAAVRMVELLRESPEGSGLLTAVSGILTKQGVSLWSGQPGERPGRYEDVSDDVGRELERWPVTENYRGRARIASATVLSEATGPRAVFVCDVPGKRRTVASTPDDAVVATTVESEVCGRSLDLAPGHLAFAD